MSRHATHRSMRKVLQLRQPACVWILTFALPVGAISKSLLVAYVSGQDALSQRRWRAVRETWRELEPTAPGGWTLRCVAVIGDAGGGGGGNSFVGGDGGVGSSGVGGLHGVGGIGRASGAPWAENGQGPDGSHAQNASASTRSVRFQFDPDSACTVVKLASADGYAALGHK
eukprot:943349-Pleurochrysis_carterae.AAC.2